MKKIIFPIILCIFTIYCFAEDDNKNEEAAIIDLKISKDGQMTVTTMVKSEPNEIMLNTRTSVPALISELRWKRYDQLDPYPHLKRFYFGGKTKVAEGLNVKTGRLEVIQVTSSTGMVFTIKNEEGVFKLVEVAGDEK